MSKSNAFETALLEHIFQNANIPNVGDATGLRGSSTAGSLYVSLHTADPGEGGNQSSNETTYTGYARVAVARSGAGWTIAANTVANAAAITFGECTANPATITHFGIGVASAGTGALLYSGALSASLVMTVGTIPEFAAGDLTGAED